MIYRMRESKAPSAWISDDRGKHTHGGKTVCAGFHRYRGFVGCPAWAEGVPCAYCYLRNTFNAQRDISLRKGVAWVTGPMCDACTLKQRCDMSDLLETDLCRLSGARAALTKWLARQRCCATCSRSCRGRVCVIPEALTCDRWGPQVLNAGELADSFGFSPEQNPHVELLLDVFSSAETNPQGYKVLFVTKAGLDATKAHLEGRKPSENVILSWSIGDSPDQEPYWPMDYQEVAEGWVETGRVYAAGWASQRGWRVRVRLDPLMGRDELSLWKHAARIASAAPCLLRVERWTLGCLRHHGGRQAEPQDYRLAVYREVIGAIRHWQRGKRGIEPTIGLCKETPEVIREALGIEPGEMKCNCVP